jgi:hypothetical protein
MCPSLLPLLKRDSAINLIISHTTSISHLLPRYLRPLARLDSPPQRTFFPAMATSHPHLFQASLTDESEIHELVVNHFLLDRAMLQWRPAADEDLPTPNTN